MQKLKGILSLFLKMYMSLLFQEKLGQVNANRRFHKPKHGNGDTELTYVFN